MNDNEKLNGGDNNQGVADQMIDAVVDGAAALTKEAAKTTMKRVTRSAKKTAAGKAVVAVTKSAKKAQKAKSKKAAKKSKKAIDRKVGKKKPLRRRRRRRLKGGKRKTAKATKRKRPKGRNADTVPTERRSRGCAFPICRSYYPRVSSDTPSAEALTAVAAIVLFRVRAILSTPTFFLARPFNL